MLLDVFPVKLEEQELDYDLHILELNDFLMREYGDQFLFKHVITQEVAYSSLLGTQRKQIHKKIAEVKMTGRNI